MKSGKLPSALLPHRLPRPDDLSVPSPPGGLLPTLTSGDDTIAAMMADTIPPAPQLPTALKEGAAPRDLLELVLGIIPFEVLEEKEVSFKCNCSFDRAVQLISSLGRDEVASMLEEDKGAAMTCGFCNEIYTLDEQDLQKMLA